MHFVLLLCVNINSQYTRFTDAYFIQTHFIFYRLIRGTTACVCGILYSCALRWFIRHTPYTIHHTPYTISFHSTQCIQIVHVFGRCYLYFAFMFIRRAGFISIAFLWRLLCNLYGILIHTNTWTLLLMLYFFHSLLPSLFGSSVVWFFFRSSAPRSCYNSIFSRQFQCPRIGFTLTHLTHHECVPFFPEFHSLYEYRVFFSFHPTFMTKE